MIAALLFAALAQCGPSGCPAPVMAPSYRMPFDLRQPVAANPIWYREVDTRSEPRREYGWHRIICDSMKFQVWGFVTPSGLIEWDADLKENVEQYRLAKVARDKASEAAKKPAPAPEPEATVTNYGIDTSKMNHGQQRYTANSEAAASFVREAQAQADHKADRCYVTVIGDTRDRKRVVDDWNSDPAFKEWHDKVWFQQFKKNDWQVNDTLGYNADGSPTILVQKPDGQVLLRTKSYTGPAPIVNALRKADPHYKPSNDPTPDDAGLFSLDDSHAYLAIGAALVAVLVLLPRRKKK